MASLPILNGHEVTLILKIHEGEILHVDLASLFFIAKYGGYNTTNQPFLSVHIPERSDDEDGHTIPAIDYDIIIQEKEKPHGQD